MTPYGHPTISAHRFRHTVGTQLAEQGVRLHTIMRVLRHTDPAMSMVYAQISDPEVLRDYQGVPGPGAAIAGPLAVELRRGTLPQADVDWLKSNFFKTEPELGHCLRLPQEGPCECDLYLNCAKFVTSSAYGPPPTPLAAGGAEAHRRCRRTGLVPRGGTASLCRPAPGAAVD